VIFDSDGHFVIVISRPDLSDKHRRANQDIWVKVDHGGFLHRHRFVKVASSL
jgi:hypothetical protein